MARSISAKIIRVNRMRGLLRLSRRKKGGAAFGLKMRGKAVMVRIRKMEVLIGLMSSVVGGRLQERVRRAQSSLVIYSCRVGLSLDQLH